MPKSFNICSNLTNGAGLQRDYELLRAELERLGHTVRPIMWNKVEDRANADVNIFLEVIKHDLMPYAAENWLVPNPEWFQNNLFHPVLSFTGILCKTRDSERIFREIYPQQRPRIIYSSWLSPDLYDPDIPRNPTFLHVAGNSQTKNTPAVFDAWRTGLIPGHLTVLSRWYPQIDAPNVSVFQRVSDEEHKFLVNSCKYHLCPSMYEGFGHSLNEALAVKAIAITLNAPPMNEFGVMSQLMVPSTGTRRYNNGILHVASGDNIVSAVQHALGLNDEESRNIGDYNRRGFLERREHFRRVLAELWGA